MLVMRHINEVFAAILLKDRAEHPTLSSTVLLKPAVFSFSSIHSSGNQQIPQRDLFSLVEASVKGQSAQADSHL